jgi:Zn-dependent protease with chaperone function
VDAAGWEALVRQLDAKARERPAAYRRKVVLLALLGYAFIGALVVVLVALAVGVVLVALHSTIIFLKLLIPIGALLWVIARSLYVRFEPPPGVEIARRDAPELFRMLDDVKRTIRGPRLHRVLVDENVNAGVVQSPRAGGILGSRNYLVIGLPYLFALTADEFRAVMGHELGHLSHAHGRFGAFVYRVRQTWRQLLDTFEERTSIWSSVIRGFFGWYAPYFEAYSLPVARAHEFEADDTAAEVAGREAAASSLVAGLLAGRWVAEAYLPGVFRRADDEPAPPTAAFTPLHTRIAEASTYGNVRAAFRQALEWETDVTDSHPSVAERLAQLGVAPEDAFAAATAAGRAPASETYLDGAEAALVAAVEARWATDVQAWWREAHRSAVVARRRLGELNGPAERTPELELERAQLTERFEGEDAALALYRGLADGDEAAAARFAIGRILLERGDEDGLHWLDEAMERDPTAVPSACYLAVGFLKGRDRDEEAERYVARAEQQLEVLLAAAEEREGISVDDELEAAGLPDEVLDAVRQAVGWRNEIAEAYLVRKRVELLRDSHPFFVLAIVLKAGFRERRREAKAEDDDGETIEQWLLRMVHVPGELMVARIDTESPIGRRVTAVDGALLFDRA